MSILISLFAGFLASCGVALFLIGAGGFMLIFMDAGRKPQSLDTDSAKQRLELYDHTYRAMQTAMLMLIASSLLLSGR